MAAEIVEVRVGRHAEFTRVVFELDRAAGYRIERANPSPGVSELVVSLEATSIPRRIRSSKSLIEQVEVEPSGSRSVARVRLAKGGLRLKEMILASPPRIVLDVLSDEPVARDSSSTGSASRTASRTDTATKTSSTTSTSGMSGTTSAATADRAKAEAGTGTGTKTAAKSAVASPAAKNAPSAAATPPAKATPPSDTSTKGVTATAAVDGAAKPAPETATPATDRTVANIDAKTDAEVGRAADSEEPSGAMKILQEREEALARAAREPSTSTRIERPAAKTDARPMVAKKTTKDEGGGWMTWAMAGAGAVVLLLGGFVFWRRQQRGEEVDFDAGDADEAAQDDAPIEFGRAPSSAESENPFAGLMGDEDEQLTLGAQDGTPSSTTGDGRDAFAFGDAGDGEEEKEVEEMEMISRDAVNESLGGMPSAMGGASEEFQQMMREMNRRVEALEGRVDELVDARDRLERQVAAQTEELRVQRAAIARTQRAVRNLARPEDEPEATEPALREPGPPGGE